MNLEQFQKRLATRLRQLREAAEESQQAIADKAGITKQHYQRMEGAKANPTVGSLIKVAKAFGKSVGDLLEFLRQGK